MFRFPGKTVHSYFRKLFLVAAILFCSSAVWGADRYWVGTDGNWGDTANWSNSAGGTGGWSVPGTGDSAYFPGTSAITVNFTSDTTTGNLKFNTGGTSLITLNTNGHTISTYDFMINDAEGVGSQNSNIKITGGGIVNVVSGHRFDFPDNTTSNLEIDSGTTFGIYGTYYGNGGSGHMYFTGSGTLSIPASGACLDHGANIVTYAGSLNVVPNGTPSYYNLSPINQASLPISVTANCTRASGGAVTVNFPYKVNKTAGATATYSFNGVDPAVDGNISVTGDSATASLNIASGTEANGEGITIIVYTPDGALELGRITYAQGVTVWTGATSTAWDLEDNWSGVVPGTNADVIINSGVTRYPVISSAVTLNSLTITSNANVSMTGGTLTVKDLSCTGNSKFTATGGTVNFTNATSTWSATYPANSNFYNVTIASGATLTASSDMYVGGKWTNSGTFAPGTNTVTFTGVSGSISSGGTSFYNLAINSSGTVTASTPVSASGTLNVTSGELSLGANNLTVTGATTNKGTISCTTGAMKFGGYSGTSDTISLAGGSFESSGVVTIANLKAGTSAKLTGGTGTNGITVTTATYTSSPAITTVGNVTLPGGTVGALNVGDGTYTSELTLSGSLTASSVAITSGSALVAGATGATHTISVGGSWTNSNTSGGFTAQSSTVEFTGASTTVSGSQTFNDVNFNGSGIIVSGANTFADVVVTKNTTFSGNNSFSSFKCETASVTLTFGSGKTQTVTGDFVINGQASGTPINLVSSSPSNQWTIATPIGTASVKYAKITDSESTNNSISTAYSVSGGNNVYWIFPNPVWIGGTATAGIYSWNTTANWDTNTVPTPTDKVTYLSSCTTYPTLVADVEVNEINIPSGKSLNLAGNKLKVNGTATGSYTNNGTVNTSGGTAELLSGAVTENGTWNYSGGTVKTIDNLAYKKLEISGNVSASGDITASDGIEITAAVTVTLSAATTFKSAVTLSADTTFATSTSSYALGFDKTISSTNSLSTTGSGTVTFGDAVNATSVSVAGTTAINGGSVTTTGTQGYTGAVTLGVNTTLLAGTSTVTFGSTVNSSSGNTYSLTIGNGTNTTKASFVGIVGGNDNLTTLSVIGTSTIGANITTTGAQTYTGAVTLGADTSLVAGTNTVKFTSTVNGAYSLTIGDGSNATAVTFGGTVGNSANLTALDVKGTSTINTTGITTTGNQTYTGAVTLGAATILASTGGDIGLGSITSNGKTLVVKTIATKKTLFSGGFADSASLTITGNADIYGANTFTSLTIDNSSLTAAATTVKFESGKLQRIGGTPSFKGNSTTNTLTLASTSSGNKWNVYFSNATLPTASDFSYVLVSDSNSVGSDGTTANPLGIIPITDNIHEAVLATPSTQNWFTNKFYWLGGTDSSWTEKANWAYDASGTNMALAYPPYTGSTSDITINTATTDLDLAAGISGTTAIALKSLTINSGKRLAIGVCEISTSGNIVNNGTIALYGTQTTPLSVTSPSTITHAADSTIEYYGNGTATDVLSAGTAGTYNNLLLNKTGGTITFANAVTAKSLTTNQSSVNTTGYAVTFDKTVNVSGSGNVIFGRGDGTGILEKVDVTLNNDFTATTSTPDGKLTFWGDVIVNKASGTLLIKNSGANIYFNKSVNGASANNTSLELSAATKVQFRATETTNKVGSNILNLTVSKGQTITTTSAYIIEPSGDQSYIAVDNAGTITVETGKNLSIAGNLKNTGIVTCSSGNTKITGTVANSGTITGSTGTIEIDGEYSSTGTAEFKGSSATTTFKGAVNFTNTTFTHNSGKVIFAGSSSQTLTAKADGSTAFNNIEINSGATVTTASSFSVANNWTNNGIFGATGGTVEFKGTGTVGISGANTFSTLSFTGAGATVKFSAGKTQTVNTALKSAGTSGSEITLTTDAATPSAADTNTWWNITIPSGFYSAFVSGDFEYTKVEYSKSTNDITHDWGATVTENTGASTTNWFIRKFYWYGNTDTSWTTPANWSVNSASYVASSFYPPYDTGLSEIVIRDNNTGVLKLSTGTDYKLKTLVVDANKKVDFNGQKITADSITNNGIILMTGSEDLSGVTTKTNDNNDPRTSTIQYYGAIANTTFTDGWGTAFSNIVFADGSSGTSTSVLTINGTTLIANGIAKSLTLSGSNSFVGNVTISDGTTKGGILSLTSSGNLKIANAASCASLEVTGAVTLNGNVTTTGVQKYNNAVTLGANTTLLAGTNTVTFSGTVNSSVGNNYSLAIGNGTNTTNVIFGGAVGSTTALSLITTGVSGTAGTVGINGTSIRTTGMQTYYGAVTLGNNVSFTTTDSQLQFASTLDSKDSTGRILTINTGTGAVIFTDKVGSTYKLASITVTNSGALTFSNTLDVTGALIQTNAATGATIFGGDDVTAAATTVGSATLRGTTYSIYGTLTSTGAVSVTGSAITAYKSISATSMSVTNSGVFKTLEDADITLSSGNFVQNGTGLNQLAGGITTSGTSSITFATDVYLFGTDTAMALGGGSGAITVGTGTPAGTKNLHIAATDATKVININSPLTANNIILYGGNLTLSGTNSALTTNGDLVLLGSNYNINDNVAAESHSSVTGLFAYNHTNRSSFGKSASYTEGFKTLCPDGTTAIPSGINFLGGLTVASGKIVTVKTNFYANGITITGLGSWNLVLPNNGNATVSFAEAYNTTVSNCSANYWVSAAENCSGTSNTNWDFTRPLLLANNSSNNRDMATVTDGGWTANLSGTYTVYDDVIRVEFVDDDGASPATPKKIENSNNEISAAIKKVQYYNGSALTYFEGAYVDADCATSTNGKGDLSVFYIKAATDDTWNTDATGISAGATDSTDRGHSVTQPSHRSSIPYINLPKALSGLYATLRDEHKNRIAHYYTASPTTGTANSAAGATFTATADRTDPVLSAVYTGQELHVNPNGTASTSNFTLDDQQPYDSHNFIELRYSEPVSIGNLSINFNDLNVVPEATLTTSSHGGLISNTSGITIAGYAQIASGKVSTGSRTTSNVVTASDMTVNSMYRFFQIKADDTQQAQTHRIRIAIAGYVSGTQNINSKDYYFWNGYINSSDTTCPSGNVTRIANDYILDKSTAFTSGNKLTVDGNGTTNHKLPQLVVNTGVSPSNTTTLYGSWDLTPPAMAKYKKVKEWDSTDNYYEILPVNLAAGATTQAIEMHFFDNAQNYSATDTNMWATALGWYYLVSGTPHYSSDSPLDLRGGVRFGDISSEPVNRNKGGIRICSLLNSYEGFSYTDKNNSQTGTFSTTFYQTTHVESFFGTAGSLTADTPYVGFRTSTEIGNTQHDYTVSYTGNSSSKGFITDLAGNRMEDFTLLPTPDKNPPDFSISVAAANGNQVFILFTKKLDHLDEGVTGKTEVDKLRRMVKSLVLEDALGTNLINYQNASRARVVTETESSTGIVVTLTRNLTYEETKTLMLSIKTFDSSAAADGDGDKAEPDPVTGLDGNYSMIYDNYKNPIGGNKEHCVTNFAVNALSVNYAYDGRNETAAIEGKGLYKDGDWAVRDFSETAGNYGRVYTGQDISVVTNVVESDSSYTIDEFKMHLDINPTSTAVGDVYSKNTGINTRLYLPNLLTAFNTSANTSASKKELDEESQAGTHDEIRTFVIPNSPETAGYYNWPANSYIRFLFQVMQSDGTTPVEIQLNEDGDLVPFYAVRLKDASDLTSLDLWSVKLADEVHQRGGVTILNNVINVSVKEQTVVEVNVPSDGNLNVIVMTLDGSIVKYLEHGRVTSGLHYYRWDGTNKSGDGVARGMYFIRVIGPDIDETRKVMCVKE